ncbi:TPA: hypothetical protein ACX6SG_000550 [Photobacterium damselae]
MHTNKEHLTIIVVFTAPKGGVSKTSIVKQLSFYLPKNTQYLDLDFNKGFSDVMKLKQPDPQEINVDYIENLLPNFYNDEAWNVNREKLVESLTGIDHITLLPIAISTNCEIRRLKKGKNERTVEKKKA